MRITLLIFMLLSGPAKAAPTCDDIRRMSHAERVAAADAYGLSQAARKKIIRYCGLRR